jgi:hypothetical protein
MPRLDPQLTVASGSYQTIYFKVFHRAMSTRNVLWGKPVRFPKNSRLSIQFRQRLILDEQRKSFFSR